MLKPAQPVQSVPLLAALLNPSSLRVRIRWVGLKSTQIVITTQQPAAQLVEALPASTAGRVLGSFDLPNMRVRLRWMGFGAIKGAGAWAFWILVMGLCVLAGLRLTTGSPANQTSDSAIITPTDLVTTDFSMGDHVIRMSHSSLDIGHSPDIFDNNIDTLIRGRDANPFVLDLEFFAPQAISGFTMDFGRMDFVIRVQVYGSQDTGPYSYGGEFRQQPSIPHVDLNFTEGPEQVSRIYIEIEQLNPPDEVHIHVREIVFKK